MTQLFHKYFSNFTEKKYPGNTFPVSFREEVVTWFFEIGISGPNSISNVRSGQIFILQSESTIYEDRFAILLFMCRFSYYVGDRII